MRLPSRTELLALGETLAMPFVLIAWGISTFGCLLWMLAILVLIPMETKVSFWAFAMLAWTIVAVPLGFWNFGQFLRYFTDVERRGRRLAKVALVSVCLVLSNPASIAYLIF